jgi:hypothetical protein
MLENLDHDLVVAIVASLVNLLLSLLVPPVFKNTNIPFISQVRKTYECNREVLLVSTIMVLIFVYVSLKITPWVQENIFAKLAATLPSNKFV